jgi:PKD repeat protein
MNRALRVCMLWALLLLPVSMFAQLTGTNAYYIYSNIYGGSEPWYTTTNSSTMNTVYGAGEWTADYFESVDVSELFSSSTCFIWLEGGDAMANELEDFLNANATAIEDWVEIGGHLFINSAPNEGDGMSFLFGGVSLYYAYYTNTAEPADASHPIFDGPYTPVGSSWSGGSFGHATIEGGVTTPVIVDLYDDSRVTLAEMNWGLGIVMFGGMTPTYFHSPATEATNLRNNIVAYLSQCILSDTDVGAQSIISPASGCSLGEESITVKVRNYGSAPQTNIPVNYQVDGGSIVTETWFGTLDPGTTVDYTFSATYDFSTPGDYTIAAWTSLAGDTIIGNDSSDVTISSIPIVSSFPYTEDFEDGASGWTAGGVNSTWELGYPDGPVISGPPPGTPGSENSWTTSLYDYYNVNEDSYVLGPCFDFSDLSVPYIKFDIWWETYEFWDGARLEYSLDAGDSWTPVGGIGTGENWYTSGGCYSFGYDPFTFVYNPAWEGSGGGWKTAEHDLSFLAGEPQVQLRFHFKSYAFFGYQDGVAFDNLFVGDPYANDIGVTALTSPISSPSLTASEGITVMLENFGLNDQSGFDVAYQVDGGTVVTETFAGTLAAGSTAEYTFSATADFGVDGDYDFVAWTELATDEDLSNDTLETVVSNLLPISGTDAYLIYSNIYGGPDPYFTYSSNLAMDAVFGEDEWTLDYFETVDVDAVFSTATCFIYLEGGGSFASELESFMTENSVAIQNWVASGGHLFINSSPYEGDGIDYGFGGVSMEYPYYTYSLIPGDDTHPIFDGPFTPVGSYWYGYYMGYGKIDGDVNPLLVSEYDESIVLLGEKSWGAGIAMFGSLYTYTYLSPATEYANLNYNILAYLAICTISDTDVGVQNLISPSTGCGLGDEAVTVELRNYGFEAQSDIPVNYQIDGGSVVTETWIGTLEPGETAEYTFTALADMTASADYDVAVWTSLAGDTIISNDSSDAVITSIPVISTYPYYEDFEDGASGWSAGGASSTWELGNPAGAAITGGPDADSENSWMTELDAYYNNSEKSYVLGPCFDFTSLVLPYVEFDIAWYTENYWDGAQLQYSLDAGTSWEVIGTIGSGDNWYTNYGIGFGYDPEWPSGYPEGWVGGSGSWEHAYHDITFLAGEPQVQFRFYFASDASVNWYDGVAFDNFKVADPFPDDIGVINIVDPSSAPDLGSSESVTIEVENFGTETQSGFPVSYQVDGGTIVTETFAGSIDPGATAEYTFSATADFSDDGDYEVCAWTSLVGDDDATNDNICETVSNLLPVTGDDAYYIYSNIYGGSEPWYTTTNSEAMDAAFVDGWELDYFEELDPVAVFSAATCFVWLEGGDAMANELEDFLADNSTLIEGWVASGGKLLLNAAPNEGDGMDFGFDDVELNYAWYTGTAEIVDDTHPIVTGPFTPVGTSWSGSSFGHASIEGTFDAVIVDQFATDVVVLAEKEWGAGHVMFGGMTPNYFHSPATEAANLRANILAYLSECATAPIDMAMNELIAPDGGCGMGEEVVTVEVENLSGVAVSDVTVGFQVDGGVVTEETITDIIDAYSTYTYTFIATADLSASGDHDITTYVDFPGDIDVSNDEITTTVTSLETPEVDLGPNGTYCDELELDAGNPGSTYVWSTGSTAEEIVVTESGTYSVTVTNTASGCSVTESVSVTIEYSPTASFTYTATGTTVNFTNSSTGGAAYSWNFGDGGTSVESNPSYTYGAPGVYNVTLTVSNACGSDFYSAVISVSNSIESVELANATQIYPNPTSGKTVVTMDFAASYEVSMELVNSLGQVVWSNIPGNVQYKMLELDLSAFADGVYTLHVTAGDNQFSKPIVLTK